MGCQFIFSSLFALIEPLNSILLLSPWIALGADKWGWTSLRKEIQERSYLCRGAISAVWKQCFTLLPGDLEFVITITWHTEQWVIHFRKGETAEFNSIAVRAGWVCKVFFSLISLCLWQKMYKQHWARNVVLPAPSCAPSLLSSPHVLLHMKPLPAELERGEADGEMQQL